ncbi:MAG: hypothetical protein DRP52_01240 [Planctomycetota bacterium]|nr:MAG: hypothetical protein DRP52_01240 [Planctomycetota bacterium]
MKTDNTCSQCGHKDGCRLSYEKLGKARGSNVAAKAIVAFLIPIGVFIGILAASEQLLQDQLEGRGLTLVSFFSAACVSLLAVFVIRAIRGPAKKEHGEKR